MIRKAILIAIVATLCLTCGDDEEIIRSYPKVNTLSVTDITTEGALFRAEFSERGAQKVIQYGFVWSLTTDPTLGSSEKIVINEGLESSSFKYRIESALVSRKPYYVRAFVKTEDYLVYGKEIEFFSLGSLAAQVSSVTPLSVHYKDTISIKGKNFSSSENTVAFGDVNGEVVFNSDSLIKAIIPDSIKQAEFNVSVTTIGNISTSDEKLKFLPPNIVSLSKSEVVFGDTLEIIGEHFGYEKSLNTITLNDLVVEAIETNPNKIKIVIPVIDKAFKVTVENSIGQKKESEKVNILEPEITEITPDEGFWGDEVDFIGENFGNIEEIVEVYFNGQKATITEFSNKSISTSLPTGVGNPINAKVVVNGIEASNSSFYYLGPEVESFSPKNGTWGEAVTITGNNFSPVTNENVVMINDLPSNILSSSSQEIIFTIPNDLSSKTSSLVIEVNGIQVVADEKFTLYNPVIYSINPTSIDEIGQLITISGKYFHPDIDRNTIEYNSAQLTVQSASSTELVAEINNDVPDNALVSQLIEQPVRVSNSVDFAYSSNLTLNHTAPYEILQNLNFGAFGKWFTIGNNGYVIAASRAVYKFNFVNEEWSQVSSFPGAGGRNGARYFADGFVLDGNIYYGMGTIIPPSDCNSSNPNLVCPMIGRNDFWKYDPSSNTWIQLENAPFKGGGIEGVSLNGNGYLIGKEAYLYDMVNDSWQAKASSSSNVIGGVKAYVFKNILNIILYDYTLRQHLFLSYDETLDSWTQDHSVNSFNNINDVRVVGDKVYMTDVDPQSFTSIYAPLLGYPSSYASQLIQYDPSTNSIEVISDPLDQITVIPFEYGGKLYLDGYFSSHPFYKFDPNFTP